MANGFHKRRGGRVGGRGSAGVTTVKGSHFHLPREGSLCSPHLALLQFRAGLFYSKAEAGISFLCALGAPWKEFAFSLMHQGDNQVAVLAQQVLLLIPLPSSHKCPLGCCSRELALGRKVPCSTEAATHLHQRTLSPPLAALCSFLSEPHREQNQQAIGQSTLATALARMADCASGFGSQVAGYEATYKWWLEQPP